MNFRYNRKCLLTEKNFVYKKNLKMLVGQYYLVISFLQLSNELEFWLASKTTHLVYLS